MLNSISQPGVYGSLSYMKKTHFCTEVYEIACPLIAVALKELFHIEKKEKKKKDMEIFVVLIIHEIK